MQIEDTRTTAKLIYFNFQKALEIILTIIQITTFTFLYSIKAEISIFTFYFLHFYVLYLYVADTYKIWPNLLFHMRVLYTGIDCSYLVNLNYHIILHTPVILIFLLFPKFLLEVCVCLWEDTKRHKLR